MLTIDGARHSGSGTIVRQAVGLAALTGRAVRIVNVRVRRPKPGLRPQHVQVVEAIRQLVDGQAEGVCLGSREFTFCPGDASGGGRYVWDIGSAGSTTLLTLAVLPVLAFGSVPARIEVRGGVFQDFAPSFYHLRDVVLPMVRRMGLEAEVEMGRPGYVPRGEGIIVVRVSPVRSPLRPVVLNQQGAVQRVWGIALASHLKAQRVSQRMAEAGEGMFRAAGYHAEIKAQDDNTALQPGAAFAAFADLSGGMRLGADRAGAPGRPAEAIGNQVAEQLLEDLRLGAILDRYAADQVILFSTLAAGISRFRVPYVTEHILASAWMAQEFLGAAVCPQGDELVIHGVGFRGLKQ
ncbi:MAG: RNA 3'-terminal phosphate cyclase [Candidatus Methylomirabilales bacterium]